MESDIEGQMLIPNYFTLRIGGFLKQEIDAYVEYARETAHQKIDPAEVARLMLRHFVETNEEFSAWRKTRMQENSERLKQRSWRDEAQTERQRVTAGASRQADSSEGLAQKEERNGAAGAMRS